MVSAFSRAMTGGEPVSRSGNVRRRADWPAGRNPASLWALTSSVLLTVIHGGQTSSYKRSLLAAEAPHSCSNCLLFAPLSQLFAPSHRPELSSENLRRRQLRPPLINPICPLPNWSRGSLPREAMLTTVGSRHSTRSRSPRGFLVACAFSGYRKSASVDTGFFILRYADYDHMGFGHLRVLNEDRVDSGTGFGTHPHREFEIFSYVVEGELEQCVFLSPLINARALNGVGCVDSKDSMGNTEVLRRGDIQMTSAGTGIRHSEKCHGPKPVHFLQIWASPNESNLPPKYYTRSVFFYSFLIAAYVD